MIRSNFVIAILFSIFTVHSNLNARIINVPEDIETIQEAIHESEDGDTVLVQPGEYVENINFEGKAIAVASLFLTTGNETYLDSTIINGNRRGSVVRFDHDEDENSLLTGFTLTNGSGSPDLDNDPSGGGIHCRSTSPTLSHLKITENEISANMGYGGGIFTQSGSSPIISYCEITNNTVSRGGGGMYISRESNPIIRYTLLAGNTGSQAGGGIGLNDQCNPRFVNVTYINNDALDFNFDIYIHQIGTISFKNCLILPGDQYISMSNSDTVTVTYSDVLSDQEDFGGNDGVLIWDDSNINEDPEFVDEEADDFHLNEDSPCIDVGDPDSPEDPDGTRADMGAYPFMQGSIVIEGYVLDADNNQALTGVTLITSYAASTHSDTTGFWRFSPARIEPFNITASFPSYLDSTITDIELEMDDTLEVTISLLHSEFTPSEERFTPVLNSDDSTLIDFSINNTGNGTLNWQAEKRLSGEAGVDPWEQRRSYSVSDTVLDPRIEGVVFVENAFYVSGSNLDDDEHMIYVLDRDGHEINCFPQFGESHYGMRDLAWDGELIWGCSENMIYGFTTEGDSITAFEEPDRDLRVITWDTDRELLWVARKIGRWIYACNTDGNCVDTLSCCDLRLHGLTYWQDDPDGYNLYILHDPYNPSQIVHKMNTETGDTMFVARLEHEEGGRPGGAFITSMYDPRSTVFMNITNNGANDRIDVWQLVKGNTSWMTLEPMIGEVQAEASQNLTLSITSEGLTIDDPLWEGELVFTHNTAGGETILPVTLTIRPDAVEKDNNLAIPDELCIAGIYPNPFNSITRIVYNVPQPSYISLTLYDIAGRVITTLVNEDLQAGVYTSTLNAGNLPSGLYFVKLNAGGQAFTRKIMLLK